MPDFRGLQNVWAPSHCALLGNKAVLPRGSDALADLGNALAGYQQIK